MSRLDHLTRFYSLLDRLESKLGGKRKLSNCNGRIGWPNKGIYFFFEEGLSRSDSGSGPRVVRVGTHGLTVTSKSTLWGRLRQHKGAANNAGGNHRGSIFRLIVGSSLKNRSGHSEPHTWGIGSDLSSAAARLHAPPESIKMGESELEKLVSRFIGNMPFLWLRIEDPSGPDSLRGRIEQNSIALLSNYNKTPLDQTSVSWLGLHCDRSLVQQSGLWNNNHVNEAYDPLFLDDLEELIAGL